MTQSAGYDEPRSVLDRLIHERGEDYASLSKLIGRNAAYIQQFVKRGTPKHLHERDRAILAAYLNIDEHLLGAPEKAGGTMPHLHGAAMVTVPRLDIGASAGGGSFADGEQATAHFAFERNWVRGLGANPAHLAVIRVQGDSMLPTLSNGDEIMVDSADGFDRLRDGIYVLRRDAMLLVKRIARQLGGGPSRVSIISDNDAYPSERDVPVRDLDLVGRVVWMGRELR